MQTSTYDYVVVGSGFGGSVCAMRLAEKGYGVLVLERGRRYADGDFPRSNWHLRKYLWLPALRCFGIQSITLFKDIMVLASSGVGGGSLVYGNVMMEPEDPLFEAPGWRDLQDWKTCLRPHYATSRRMLGVTRNPHLTAADRAIQALAAEDGRPESFWPTDVAVYFGQPGETTPDPYFDGVGPPRAGCNLCGGCMIGCRHNAKNTLLKNYLYFAETWGARIQAEAEVVDIRPLAAGQPDGARYVVVYRPTRALRGQRREVRARQVMVAAHALGTMKLLFHCRDVSRSLPQISDCLGHRVYTNSEALNGSTSWDRKTDYSTGVAITSGYKLDEVTHVEPVRYPRGSSLYRLLAIPMIDGQGSPLVRLVKVIIKALRYLPDYAFTSFTRRWAQASTILLFMQTTHNTLRMRLGRSPWTLFRRGLVSERLNGEAVTPPETVSHHFAYRFAAKTGGVAQDSIPDTLLGIPATAHLIGGCSIGRSAAEGVVDVNFEVFNYPGLYVVDGSIMPGNPGINPSLTIVALAEYAMSRIPFKAGRTPQPLLGVNPPSED